MKLFIESNFKGVEYKDSFFKNNPVNILNVLTIRKGICTMPYGREFETIVFNFGNDNKTTWYYYSEEDQEKDYQMLINCKSRIRKD